MSRSAALEKLRAQRALRPRSTLKQRRASASSSAHEVPEPGPDLDPERSGSGGYLSAGPPGANPQNRRATTTYLTAGSRGRSYSAAAAALRGRSRSAGRPRSAPSEARAPSSSVPSDLSRRPPARSDDITAAEKGSVMGGGRRRSEPGTSDRPHAPVAAVRSEAVSPVSVVRHSVVRHSAPFRPSSSASPTRTSRPFTADHHHSTSSWAVSQVSSGAPLPNEPSQLGAPRLSGAPSASSATTGGGPFPPPSPVAQGRVQPPSHQGGTGTQHSAAQNVGSEFPEGNQSSSLQAEIDRLDKANRELTEVSCYNSQETPGLDSSLRLLDVDYLSSIVQ